MRCPKCNAEIEQGFLYCKVCGAEIRIVPDYNPEMEDVLADSIDGLIKSDDTVDGAAAATGPETSAEDQAVSDNGGAADNKPPDKTPDMPVKTPSKDIRKVPRHKRSIIPPVILTFLAIVAVIYLVSRIITTTMNNSVDYQYNEAQNYADEGDYEHALTCLNRAMEINSDYVDLWLLKAQIGEAMDDEEMVVTSYQYILDNLDSQNEIAIRALLNIYIQNDNISQVKVILAGCTNQEILDQYSKYIVQVPQSSFPDGEYYDTMKIELDAGGLDIYYTLDGSAPDTNSFHYEDPIYLEEGHTTIRAVAVSPDGIVSDESIFNYDITKLIPDAPVITPESGTYKDSVEIVVIVPDGCTVLYTLDGSEPTLDSKVYEDPITVRKSTVFTAISVSLTDTESDPVVMNYKVVSSQPAAVPDTQDED